MAVGPEEATEWGVSPSPLPSEHLRYNGKLLAAQQRKKHAGHDAQVLANRISLLKKEESKAWKKISTTRKRAEEVLRMREDNERRALERIKAAEAAELNQRVVAARYAATEEAARIQRLKLLEDLQNKRREGVAQVRAEKQVWRRDLVTQRQINIMDNQRKRMEIKAREEEQRRLRENERARTIEMNKRKYKERVQSEEASVRMKEREVAQMEKVEMQLIQQLKDAQTLQQHAYHQLENALNDSRTS